MQPSAGTGTPAPTLKDMSKNLLTGFVSTTCRIWRTLTTAQHVVAGQVECQTCHGPVEEMEEVYQYSSLTMGWCIDCHRKTEVKMEENPYYDKLHKQLAGQYKGGRITVDKIGGLECGKCHY